MTNRTLEEAIIREIATLPEARQEDVLAFVRFLKIGLADEQTIEQQFTNALDQALVIAKERNITDQDINAEIRAVRSKQ
ncbi:MAG TPA: hypothetical protein VI755_03445 [Anaerolineales bacterium]|nr:hypothetical protein [Anaerolineales bacterium]